MAEIGASNAGASPQQIVRELAADFDGMPVDDIEKLVTESFRTLSRGARVKTFVPVLTKRVVREELRARTTSAV